MSRFCCELQPCVASCGQPGTVELVLESHGGRAIRAADWCTGCFLREVDNGWALVKAVNWPVRLTWPGHDPPTPDPFPAAVGAGGGDGLEGTGGQPAD